MEASFKTKGYVIDPSEQPSHPARWFMRENIAAVISWAVFCYIQLIATWQQYHDTPLAVVATAVGSLVFLALFFQVQHHKQSALPWLGLTCMWLIMSSFAVLTPQGFAPGFAVLWGVLLPWFVPVRWLYWMLIPSLTPVLLGFALNGLSQNDVMMVLVCGTFQFFGMFAMSKARDEQLARAELWHIHQQLVEAQSQLATQAADAERLRIARDLHDSLGHHLTALVIQLQVTSFQSTAEQKPQIERCQQLAKQLLQEIRYSVSQLRDPRHTPLARQLQQLQGESPELAIELQLAADLTISPLASAVLFRVCQEAITNSRRHAGASQCRIDCWRHGNQVQLRYTDNGQLTSTPLVEGNGLRGMRERLEQANGCLLLSYEQGHVQLDAILHDPVTP